GSHVGPPDRRVHIDPVQHGVRGGRIGADLQHSLDRDLGDGVGVGRVHIGLEHGERHRPVHRPGVEITGAQRLRQPARDGGLARPGRAVDSDHHTLCAHASLPYENVASIMPGRDGTPHAAGGRYGVDVADPSVSPTTAWTLLRERTFRRYWSAQTISYFGDQVTLLAMPLLAVLVLHASPAQMGLLTAAGPAPNLLLSPAARV